MSKELTLARTRLGATEIRTSMFQDNRGWFSEVTGADQWKLLGDFKPVGLNISHSRSGVIRGLHLQAPSQAKLVRCVEGEIIDVIVDLRKDSSTHGQWEHFYLNDPTHSVFVPHGFAHGFLALGSVTVEYLVDKEYAPDGQFTLNPFCPQTKISWKELWLMYSEEPPPIFILSDKDRTAPDLINLHS